MGWRGEPQFVDTGWRGATLNVFATSNQECQIQDHSATRKMIGYGFDKTKTGTEEQLKSLCSRGTPNDLLALDHDFKGNPRLLNLLSPCKSQASIRFPERLTRHTKIDSKPIKVPAALPAPQI
jgi:hypothetical protein